MTKFILDVIWLDGLDKGDISQQAVCWVRDVLESPVCTIRVEPPTEENVRRFLEEVLSGENESPGDES